MPHTPGKWDCACDMYGKVQHSRKACVYTDHTGIPQMIAQRITNWDDAALIAAAPDLLAACEAALKVLERDLFDDYSDVETIMRAAINAAKGESS